MITLTTEQAQQIEEAVAFAASHSEYLADDLILYGEALATIRAARAQGNALMSYKEKAESVNAILAGSHISRGNKQLADWLMRCPQTGEKLRLAGAPEQFGHMSRVRLRDSDGNDWTLTAGLQEGWLTEEQRLANLAVAIAEETEAARAQEQAEQEPVAWVEVERGIPMFANFSDKYKPNGDGFIPLYAAPVQQVDLTDDEIQEAMMSISPTGMGYFIRIARAVIAADREKNK